MQSALHSMIQKAHRYAEEPQRVAIFRLETTVRGDNNDHVVRLEDGRLRCECDHYAFEGLCAHVLTVERLFKAHLPHDVAPFPGPSPE
jgi:hypothetical protein